MQNDFCTILILRVTVISNKNFQNKDVNSFINVSRLKIEDEIEYLSIVLNSTLKFDKNTNVFCKKLGQKVNVLSRLRRELQPPPRPMYVIYIMKFL